jgi:hypothetical protein
VAICGHDASSLVVLHDSVPIGFPPAGRGTGHGIMRGVRGNMLVRGGGSLALFLGGYLGIVLFGRLATSPKA